MLLVGYCRRSHSPSSVLRSPYSAVLDLQHREALYQILSRYKDGGSAQRATLEKVST